MTGAIKYDTDKLRLELVPVRPLEDWARILTYGAKKYTTTEQSGDRNWEKGFSWSRIYGSLQRHLTRWFGGEDLDPESGFSHLAHAMCNLGFLLEFLRTHPELDDRPKGVK